MCHIFNDRRGAKELLRDIRPWNGSVSGASTESIENKITAIGTLVLKVQNESGEVSNIEIDNVRFVENFSVTLIRPQQLFEEIGIKADFYTNELIGPEGRIIGKIMEDPVSLPDIVNCEVQLNKEAKGLISRSIWHERLGHISSEYIYIMKKNELVEGMNMHDQHQHDVEKCEICYTMNNQKNNFKRIEENKERKYLVKLYLSI
jgi:hypothetical protein